MERIYHYTSVDAFDKMLREMKRHGSKELLFWASNIHYMNDPNEMSFLYDKLVDLLPELEKDMDIKQMPFSTFLSLGKNQQRFSLDLFKDIKDRVFNGIFKSAYAISFSKRGDYLPMWSLYGNNGSGLCLEFDYEALKERFTEADNLTRLIEQHYYIKELFIWARIGAFYKLYHDKLSLKDDNINPLSLCREFLARVLIEMAPILKHESYEYEKEVRLFYHVIMPGDVDDVIAKADIQPTGECLSNEDLPKVRVRNGLLVPYKEIGIPVDFIKRIIVGPSLYPRLQSEALKVLLNEFGLERIHVDISEVPYRQM